MFGLSYAIFRGHPDGREEVDDSALVPMLVLFAAFAAFSFTFWGYFLVRARVAVHPPPPG